MRTLMLLVGLTCVLIGWIGLVRQRTRYRVFVLRQYQKRRVDLPARDADEDTLRLQGRGGEDNAHKPESTA